MKRSAARHCGAVQPEALRRRAQAGPPLPTRHFIRSISCITSVTIALSSRHVVIGK
jgi:hypothetical protein